MEALMAHVPGFDVDNRAMSLDQRISCHMASVADGGGRKSVNKP
jgi:hypothetical protein